MLTLNFPFIFFVILRISYIVLLASMFGLIGCIKTQAAVVTSIRPLGFITAAIADGVTPVKVILPDGASPHNYALRPTNVMQIKKSDLLIWVGPELESFLNHLTASLPTEKCITLAYLPSIMSLLMKSRQDNNIHYKNDYNTSNATHMSKHYHCGEYNMHIWLSPAIASRIAEIIHNRLLILLPEKKKH